MTSVKRFFNDYVEDFDAIYGKKQTFLKTLVNSFFRQSMKERFERTIINCSPINDKTVLDVGCGPGHYCIALAQNGAKEVLGIDFSKEMIKTAEEKAFSSKLSHKCNFIVADVNSFNPKQKFDYAIVMGVMDYIDTPEKFIKKILGLVNDKILFSFPVDGGILAWQRKLRYKNKCFLKMYMKDELENIFDRLCPNQYIIEKLHRDFFVLIKKK